MGFVPEAGQPKLVGLLFHQPVFLQLGHGVPQQAFGNPVCDSTLPNDIGACARPKSFSTFAQAVFRSTSALPARSLIDKTYEPTDAMASPFRIRLAS